MKKIKNTKKIKKISEDQNEDLKKWLLFYEENNKLPYTRIICNRCKTSYVNLNGVALSNAKKQFDNDIKKILTESICKECKNILFPKEKKETVSKLNNITREEMEDRAEEIRKDIPKIDLHKPKTIIDMRKDKEMCKKITSSACWRPDIYLDYGCNECSLVKNCACSIKNLKRIPTPSHRVKNKKT